MARARKNPQIPTWVPLVVGLGAFGYAFLGSWGRGLPAARPVGQLGVVAFAYGAFTAKSVPAKLVFGAMACVPLIGSLQSVGRSVGLIAPGRQNSIPVVPESKKIPLVL